MLKLKHPRFPMDRASEQTFLQRHVDGQQAHKTKLSISGLQGNAGQSHSETSLHTHQEGPKGEQMANAGEGVQKLELSRFAGGRAERHSPFGKCLASSQKIKKSYGMKYTA